jgi:hypothetical protein
LDSCTAVAFPAACTGRFACKQQAHTVVMRPQLAAATFARVSLVFYAYCSGAHKAFFGITLYFVKKKVKKLKERIYCPILQYQIGRSLLWSDADHEIRILSSFVCVHTPGREIN